MKTSRILILVFGFILSFQFMNAQNLNQIQRGQRGYVPQSNFSTGTYIEKVDPYKTTERVLVKCNDEFQLDAFQSEILKSMLITKFEKHNSILEDLNNNRDSRKKKLTDLENQFLKDLNQVFTAQQIKDYQHMNFDETKAERKKRKKDEKRKKKNKS